MSSRQVTRELFLIFFIFTAARLAICESANRGFLSRAEIEQLLDGAEKQLYAASIVSIHLLGDTEPMEGVGPFDPSFLWWNVLVDSFEVGVVFLHSYLRSEGWGSSRARRRSHYRNQRHLRRTQYDSIL